MEKSKKFRMPSGIRNKLMAAVAMLLVSSIMMVTSTYAWFTLSTAPEVTGITTSVGANGNLEIALLNTDTFGDLSQIKSAVGNSSAATGDVTLSNVTWGNLVDLSAAAYGLNSVSLMPAALNGTKDAETQALTKVNATNPLLTAVYGADGRVSTVDGSTVSAVAGANGAFAYGADQTYGVRAIGVTSNLSVREISFNSARSTVRAAINSAKTATKAAIYNNMGALLGYASSDASTLPEKYSSSDVAAFLEIANGVVSDLATLENAYKSAVIAKVATGEDIDDAAFAILKAQIEGMTLAELSNKAAESGVAVDGLADLIIAQTSAGEAKSTLATAAALDTDITASTTTNVETVNDAIKKLVSNIEKNTTDGIVVYISGGAVGELGAQVGTFQLASVGSLGAAYAGSSTATTAKFTVTLNAVNNLTAPTGGSDANNITDTYGYIIDFAFRTNAAGSSLQLQTTPANRVYTNAEGSDLATQGAGSTVTFAYAAGMNETQVNKLLSAIKLVFLNTATGDVYATAGLTDINVGASEAVANVKVTGQTGDVGTIVSLEQNVAKTVSVLVYMDGDMVDNSAVINAQNSGMLNLNLQFSSSAELIPMQNTALQNMTAYTVSFNANGGTGIMPAVKVTGESYTVPTTASFTAPAGKQFKGWATEATGAVVTSVNLTGNTTLYAIWEDVPASGGDDTQQGGGETPDDTTAYNVTVAAANNGTVTANPTSAAASAEVTLTVNPNDGYALDTLTVTDASGNPVTVTDNKFTMPAGNVTVTATFVTRHFVTVSVPAGVTGEGGVADGHSYTFTVNEGYTLTKVTMENTDITSTLTPTNNSYTIENVTGAINITVYKNS